MDNKGTIIGGISLQTVMVIGLAAMLVYFAIWGNPFDKGGVNIDLGYIMNDGTYVPINTNTQMIFYFNSAAPLTWYTDSGHTQPIAGIYGKLSIKAVPSGFQADTVAISWSGSSTAGAVTNSGNKTISTNQWVTIEESKLEAQHFWSAGDPTTVDMNFDVTATAEGVTATTTTSASISIYWGSQTLTLDASTDIGTLDLVK